jgi:hypothetical protein
MIHHNLIARDGQERSLPVQSFRESSVSPSKRSDLTVVFLTWFAGDPISVPCTRHNFSRPLPCVFRHVSSTRPGTFLGMQNAFPVFVSGGAKYLVCSPGPIDDLALEVQERQDLPAR